MKKKIEIAYDGLNSIYGVDEDGLTLLIVLKKPDSDTLKVMVTEVEAKDIDVMFLDWEENWVAMGVRAKQELLRTESPPEIDILEEE